MRHLVNKGRKFNKTAAHRKAMFKNMLVSFIKEEKITTTVEKAKDFRSIVEKIITRAKEDSIHNRRMVRRFVEDKNALIKLFKIIAPRYKNRNGGYTRIIKLGYRKGDNAPLSIIELVESNEVKNK
ncbi:MAG: 50S ribosomal protein L17 [Spirochaetes bacterium]|nr:50S ribosomal protein L17 [Spirochaetota bacterium]